MGKPRSQHELEMLVERNQKTQTRPKRDHDEEVASRYYSGMVLEEGRPIGQEAGRVGEQQNRGHGKSRDFATSRLFRLLSLALPKLGADRQRAAGLPQRDACLPVHFAEQRPDPNVSISATSFDAGYEVLANTNQVNNQSLIVNVHKNVWLCQLVSWVAARGGTLGGKPLDFVAVRENCSIRDAAVRLQRLCGAEVLRLRPQTSAILHMPASRVSERTALGSAPSSATSWRGTMR